MPKAVIIGAGINGLVAANYLARAGFTVTVVERKDHPGGACCAGTLIRDGVSYEYPQGASVLGFMQDFVFHETGLADRIAIGTPDHPEIVYAVGSVGPAFIWDDPLRLKESLSKAWGEEGNVDGFLADMEKVVAFLREGYRAARVPTLESATAALGTELVDRWITGSARALLDHYLTSEPLKIYYAVSVYESGPVPLDSPYSAFTIPLMASGGVFDGEWGYVKGGIWRIPLELNALNEELGVETVLSATVTSVAGGAVQYEKDGRAVSVEADYVIFATDPLSAARLSGQVQLETKISKGKLLGTSAKLVMLFRAPVRWKDDTGLEGFAAAFRHIIPVTSLDEAEGLSEKVARNEAEFTPGYFEIYCEGAGDRDLGGGRPYDLVSVFFKNMAFSEKGEDLPDIKGEVTRYIVDKIENPEDLITTILETPKDIADLFFFPQGNIDHVEISEGQTFFQRTYSSDPENDFYRFGSDPRILYCAAGAYPCGSVAGTPGYMCAMQLIARHRDSGSQAA